MLQNLSAQQSIQLMENTWKIFVNSFHHELYFFGTGNLVKNITPVKKTVSSFLRKSFYKLNFIFTPP